MVVWEIPAWAIPGGKYRPGNKRPSGQYQEIYIKNPFEWLFFSYKKSYEVKISKFKVGVNPSLKKEM